MVEYEIARKYNIDWRTAKKYCESNTKSDYKYTNPRKKNKAVRRRKSL